MNGHTLKSMGPFLLLVLIMAAATACVSAAEVEQARFPYQSVRLALETKRVGVFRLSYESTWSQGEKLLAPVAAYIDSKTGRIPIVIEKGKFLNFPIKDELSKENPSIVVNRPKGTMFVTFKAEFDFVGDHEHPYRCAYRDLMGLSVFTANFDRLSENKPALSGEELHGWAPDTVLMETAGKKASIEIKSQNSGSLSRTISNGRTPIPLYSDAWRENPPVLLAFKPEDVRVIIDGFPPRLCWPYKVMRTLLEKKRAGVYEILPICYPKPKPEPWPPLEIYVDAKSGRIPLKLHLSSFQDFPFTDELSKENPFVVVNRPAEAFTMLLAARFTFESKAAKPFKCRYREFMEPAVFWAAISRASVGLQEQSVDEMERLPFIEFRTNKTVSFETNIRGENQTLTLKEGKHHILRLQKELWRENPEMILHFEPQDVAQILICPKGR
ncbi:MAG: hypothetical protein WA117_01235 [Verrucomicrobiia bacterium]